VLRRAFQHPTHSTDDELRRDLADYDTAFGVDFGNATHDEGQVA
jgi:hypothetical protein